MKRDIWTPVRTEDGEEIEFCPTHLCEIRGKTAFFGPLHPHGETGWICTNCKKTFPTPQAADEDGIAYVKARRRRDGKKRASDD